MAPVLLAASYRARKRYSRQAGGGWAKGGFGISKIQACSSSLAPRSRVRIEEALALRFVNKMFSTDEVPAPEVFGWKTAGDNGSESTFISST